EAKIPEQAPEFENAFVVYPFNSFLTAESAGSRAAAEQLGKRSFIGIKPSDLNRLRFSAWKYHPEKLVALAPVTFRNQRDFNAHRLLRAMDNNMVLSKLPLSEQASHDEIMMREEELQ